MDLVGFGVCARPNGRLCLVYRQANPVMAIVSPACFNLQISLHNCRRAILPATPALRSWQSIVRQLKALRFVMMSTPSKKTLSPV